MDTQKILIVGGAGYIGGFLTDLLKSKGYEVTVLDNLLYETRFLKQVNFILGDISDHDFINEVTKDYDIVVWLAAIVGDGACAANKEKAKLINEDAVKNLVDNFNGKIIFTSTCSVYGENKDFIDEEATPNPLSVYAETKLAAEQYIVHNYDDYLIFRLGTLHGMGDLFSRIRLDLVVNILTCKAVMGEELSVFGGEQWRPLVHVKDVSRAILFGLNNNVKGLYNLSENNYKIIDIAESIQSNIENVKIDSQDMPFEDQRNYKVKNQKILETGWRPDYSLDDGIKDIAKVIKGDRIIDIKDPIYSNESFLKKIKY